MFSQNILIKYPKKSIIGTDTVFILSKPQFIDVNLALIERQELKETINIYLKQNELLYNQVNYYTKSDSLLRYNLVLKDSVIENKIEDLKNKNAIIKIQEKTIKARKRERNIFMVVAGSLLISLFIR